MSAETGEIKDFSQETTLHGVKYIFERESSITRRAAWGIVSVSAFGLFVYLVATKLIDYYSWPSQVDLVVEYTPTLRFPAVTICNQNPYRFTALQERGLYDVIIQSYTAAYGRRAPDATCELTFELFPNVCAVTTGAVFSALYRHTTLAACKLLCVRLESDSCSAVVYDRLTQDCVLTSLTAETADREVNCTAPESARYYRRHRCLEQESFFCDFESEDCEVVSGNNSTDVFERATGDDFTSGRSDGHYMNFLETGVRPEYRAELVTPYMNTTNKCLVFMYGFMGDAVSPIDVISVDEDLTYDVITTFAENPFSEQWLTAYVRLPKGVNRVVIRATRPTEGVSGVRIDDVELNTCSFLERDCRPQGQSIRYLGSKDNADGSACLPWKSLDSHLIDVFQVLFSGQSLDEADKFCRPLAWFDVTGCFTGPDFNDFHSCDIKACKCRSESSHQCSNGRCVAERYVCDGYDDCPNGGDEVDERCLSRIHMACQFDDPFLCGYSVLQTIDSQWNLIDALDGKVGAMQMSTIDSLPGDLAVLKAPGEEFAEATIITFMANIHTKPYDTMLELRVVGVDVEKGVYSNLREPITYQEVERLLNEAASPTPWLEYRVCMPAGKRALRFEAVAGDVNEAYFGLDDITVTEETCIPDSPEDEPPAAGIDCGFDDGLCGSRVRTLNTLFAWELMAKMHVSEAVRFPASRISSCNEEVHYFSTHGHVASFGFPYSYENYLECASVIVQPLGAETHITIETMDIEYERNCDYDTLLIQGHSLPNDAFGSSNLTQRLCGNEIMEFEVFTENVSVCFTTDFSVVKRGFQLHYEVSLVPDTDYVVALTYHGDAKQRSHNGRDSSLMSVLTPLDVHSCLSFLMRVADNLEVKLVKEGKGDAESVSILRVNGNLGEEWHRMYLTLLPLPGLWSVAFSGEYPALHYSAFLDDVTLRDGQCEDLVQSGSLDCDFSSMDQCGYRDVTIEGASRWTRKCGNSSDCYMEVSVSRHTGLASLVSVERTVAAETCLKYRVACAECTTSVVQVGSQSTLSVQFHVADHLNAGDLWADMSLVIPAGPTRVWISASKGVAVDDIRMETGVCQNLGNPYEITAPVPITNTRDETIEMTVTTELHQGDNKQEEAGILNRQAWEAMIKDLEGESLETMVDETSYSYEDTILTCLWGGRPCAEYYTRETDTDMGRCVTFNWNNESVLMANSSGAASGLSLWLNVGEYQYVPGVSTVSGFKVLLHDQDDVAQMDNLGFNIAPGQHVLASLNYGSKVFERWPYGTCGELPLSYYDNVTYTFGRCASQCEAETMALLCNCTDVYMPGDVSTCGLDAYLTCVLPVELGAMTTDVLCPVNEKEQCKGACKIREFAADLSYTQLSESAASAVTTEAVVEDYRTALELQERLSSDLLAVTLGRMRDLEDNLREIVSYFEFNVFSRTTSLFSRIDNAAQLFHGHVREDVELLYADLVNRSEAYRIHVEPGRRELQIQISKLDTEVSAALMYVLSSLHGLNLTKLDEIIASLTTLVYEVNSFLRSSFIYYAGLQDLEPLDLGDRQQLYDKLLLPKQMITSKDRQSQCAFLLEYTWLLSHKSVLDWFMEIANVAGGESGFGSGESGFFVDLAIIDDAVQQSKLMMSCATDYGTHLKSMTTHHEDVDAALSLTVAPAISLQESLAAIQRVRGIISQFYREYSTANITKATLASGLSSVLNAKLQEVLRDVENRLDISYVAPRLAVFAELQRRIASVYMAGLKDLVDLGEYFSQKQNAFDDRTKELYLWQEPLPNLDSSPPIKTRRNADYGRHTIPNLGAFLTSAGKTKIPTIVRQFYDELSQEMALFQSELVGRRLKLDEVFAKLLQDLGDFTRWLEPDSEFTRQNLVRLDIYYAQLRVEKTTQTISYGMPEFWGDVGGYLGLLLGASALSVVEILDWLMLKMFARRRNKARQRPPPEGTLAPLPYGNVPPVYRGMPNQRFVYSPSSWPLPAPQPPLGSRGEGYARRNKLHPSNHSRSHQETPQRIPRETPLRIPRETPHGIPRGRLHPGNDRVPPHGRLATVAEPHSEEYPDSDSDSGGRDPRTTLDPGQPPFQMDSPRHLPQERRGDRRDNGSSVGAFGEHSYPPSEASDEPTPSEREALDKLEAKIKDNFSFGFSHNRY